MVQHKLVAVPDSLGYWKLCAVDSDGNVLDIIMTALGEGHAKRWAASHNEKKD
jgi:hypothetical protein